MPVISDWSEPCHFVYQLRLWCDKLWLRLESPFTYFPFPIGIDESLMCPRFQTVKKLFYHSEFILVPIWPSASFLANRPHPNEVCRVDWLITGRNNRTYDLQVGLLITACLPWAIACSGNNTQNKSLFTQFIIFLLLIVSCTAVVLELPTVLLVPVWRSLFFFLAFIAGDHTSWTITGITGRNEAKTRITNMYGKARMPYRVSKSWKETPTTGNQVRVYLQGIRVYFN